MGSASKVVEHMEHAAHAPSHEGGHGSPLAKRIGATMAILGAILALFTMSVAAARTELLGLYTQETIASLRAETSATKYRFIETQLRQLHSLTPPVGDVKSTNGKLDAIAAQGPDAARAVTIARLAVDPVLSGLTPTATDVERFVRLVRSYRTEREAAMQWSDSFVEPKKVLTTAIEHYEWAELCAELGVVASSLALLFSSRRIWIATLALGATGLAIFVLTFVPTMRRMHEAEHVLAEAKTKTESCVETAKAEADEDDALLRAVEGGR